MLPNFLKVPDFKRLGRRYRRKLFEFWGSDRYSKLARNHLDRKLERYLPEQGFFIEAGANDGISQSNTYYLENLKGWRGILIEPIPQLYQHCLRERPKAQVLNYALVSANYPESTVEMNYAHLMSTVSGAMGWENKHLENARKYYNIESYQVKVPAKNLTDILDEFKVEVIHFLSLDVEGYELNVLQGLDFKKHLPEWMLIECLSESSKEEIEAYISPLFVRVAQLSQDDYLYQLTK